MDVTSYTEVWIEIIELILDLIKNPIVTSYTEVWIEIICQEKDGKHYPVSPPIRRCGLKLKAYECKDPVDSHLLYGGVD